VFEDDHGPLMAKLTSRGYSAADQSDFISRSAQPHTLQWKASAYRWTGTGVQTLLDDIPLTGGTLTLDSSEVTRRQLTLEIGGGEDLVPKTSTDPLVPFGQFIRLWNRIDRFDGTWFPWLMQGEYPILSYVYERPSLIATVECQDLSSRVNEFLHLNKHKYAGMTVAGAIKDMVSTALPNKLITLHATNGSQGARVKNYVADTGVGRWDAATDLADKHGYETFFDSAGDLIIRDAITRDDDDIVPGTGPDIGSVSSPVAVIHDSNGGTLVGLTATVTREGGCNKVRFNLHGTVTKRAKKQDKKKKGIETVDVDWNAAVEAEDTAADSAVRWGDTFGYLPIVRDYNLHKIEAGDKAAYQQRAESMLHRRRGVIRYLDFDVAGGYWVEPDDKVSVRYGSRDEDHFIQSVEFDLAGQTPTRMRTRMLAVKDPG
jgi:hypothetical protein